MKAAARSGKRQRLGRRLAGEDWAGRRVVCLGRPLIELVRCEIMGGMEETNRLLPYPFDGCGFPALMACSRPCSPGYMRFSIGSCGCGFLRCRATCVFLFFVYSRESPFASEQLVL
jgi:hypothetical protein